MIHRPVPTRFALVLFAVGLFPAVLALLDLSFAYVAWGLDAALVALILLDWRLAPGVGAIRVTRELEPVLAAGVPTSVHLDLELTGNRAVRGEIRDALPEGTTSDGARRSFSLTQATPRIRLTYRVTPIRRGALTFGDLYLRSLGPLNLCARQGRIPSLASAKAYPDLTALARDAVSLLRPDDAATERAIHRAGEGRDFESLRDYRPGDDYRSIDWKATARKARPIVRAYEPERNQSVLLLVDCGRHMAGQVAGRPKLDYAVDAALKLAKVGLDKGDAVGLAVFATNVSALLPPRKGAEHLRALTEALYRTEARLEESDYGQVLDLAFARHHRRSLVVLFTDVLDPDTSAVLVRRTLALRPRHLPLVVSLMDDDIQRASLAIPQDLADAYVRQAAQGLESEYRLTHAQLRNAGALAVRAPAPRFGAAAVNEYLRVKSHGLL